VRELQNVLQRAALLAPGSVVDGASLRQWIGGGGGSVIAASQDPFAGLVGRSLREVEEELIARTLAQCGGNRTRAAELLGIGVRTLFNRLRVPTGR
jgi:two-component system response regulator FlrC